MNTPKIIGYASAILIASFVTPLYLIGWLLFESRKKRP